MQTFFSSIQSLETFTRSLNSLSNNSNCTSCNQSDQWVSHGYLYKQTSSIQRDIIGKRVLCSNRYGKQGCGRTRSLYLAWFIPGYRYRLNVVLLFIAGLLQGLTISTAYHHALGHDHFEPRQAYRWLATLFQQLGWFRSLLNKRGRNDSTHRASRSKRLNLLLSTLELFLSTVDPPALIQLNYQRALI